MRRPTTKSTHFVYFLALESCEIFFTKPQKFEEGKTYYSTGAKRIPGEMSQKILLAYDLDKQVDRLALSRRWGTRALRAGP